MGEWLAADYKAQHHKYRNYSKLAERSYPSHVHTVRTVMAGTSHSGALGEIRVWAVNNVPYRGRMCKNKNTDQHLQLKSVKSLMHNINLPQQHVAL